MSGSLQNEAAGAMAQAACMSRYHFQRVFEKTVGESPGALRRRLLLERAAYELRATATSVTVVALDAEYRSLEGFSRAFKRAFGLSPLAYRRAAQQVRLLPGASGVHYHPKTASLTTQPGGRNVNLVDRLLEKDVCEKRRILACMELLSDKQLDAPLAFQSRVVRFVDPPQTLRETLIYLCGENNGDMGWLGAMYAAVGWQPRDLPARTLAGTSPAALRENLEISAKAFRDFIGYVSAENVWDKEWVDAGCEPPETFAVGRVIEESLSSSIAQRRTVVILLEQMGFCLDETP